MHILSPVPDSCPPFLNQQKEKQKYVAGSDIQPGTSGSCIGCATQHTTRPSKLIQYDFKTSFVLSINIYYGLSLAFKVSNKQMSKFSAAKLKKKKKCQSCIIKKSKYFRAHSVDPDGGPPVLQTRRGNRDNLGIISHISPSKHVL